MTNVCRVMGILNLFFHVMSIFSHSISFNEHSFGLWTLDPRKRETCDPLSHTQMKMKERYSLLF